MATLIQSKQIQGIVTASNIEGNFNVEGSIVATGSDSIFGAITASVISSSGPIYGVRYSDIQGTPNFVAGSGILITQAGNEITITNTGGGGGVSGSVELITDVTRLKAYTGSNDIIITGLENFTASIQSQVDSLTSATSSYLTDLPSGLISSSEQLTSSLDSRYALSGSVGGGSSTDISSINDFTSSSDTRITNLENFSSSLDSTFATDTELSSLSSSIAQTIDNIQHTQIPSGVVSGSTFTDFSSSIESRLSTLEGANDNIGSDTQTLSISGDQLTISDGNTITIPTGSDISLPNGLISSSQQIEDLGFVTSALDAPFDGDRVVSNTLLSDLYTGEFNAGTSGSLAQFIEQVFFPTNAPTATFTNQTAKFNTNLATNGTNLVSVSITDTVDNSPYTLVLSGTNASSLTAVPTNVESSSWEIRANGDLTTGTYSYDVTVGDSTNAERTYSGRSITIAQATSGTLTTNGTLYIIESATSGVITLSSSGIPGSVGSVSVSYSPNYGSQVATNFTSSNPLISVNSTTGQLSVGSPISGSGNLSGDTITSTISWEDQYGNSDSDTISVNVTTNNAPSVASTQVSNNNTNQAINTNLILQLTISDTEGDSIPNSGLVFSGYNTTYLSETISTPYMQLRVNSTNVPAGNYPYTASLTDEHGFRTREVTGTFTINQADDGNLGGDINNYIIESALTNDVLRDATGYNGGNPSRVTVSYSPNYGSQAIQSFTSTNPAVEIDSSGYLTLGVDLSGSVTQSGDTFSSTIGWTDQYGNSDSRSINVTVFGNQSPVASFTDDGLNGETAINGADIGTLTITDTESNSPFQVTIGGTDGSKFNIIPQNDASSSWEVHPNQSLSVGDYSVQFTVTDSYSEQATLNETILVSPASDFGKVYVYTSTRVAAGELDPSNYIAVMGAEQVDSSTPPLVSTYSADANSPFKKIKEGSLGQSSISVTGGQLDLRQEVSGSNLNTIISSSFGEVGEARQILVIFPSGSDMTGTPTSMTDSLGGSTPGEYVMFVKGGGDTSFGSETSTIHGVELDSPHEGYSTWYIIGRTGVNADTSYEVQIIPSSGSAPS